MATTTITSYLTSDQAAAAYGGTVAAPTAELIQLFDDPVNPAGTLNTAKLAQLVTLVNGMMDSKIGVKYSLPLTVDTTDATRVGETLLGYALALFRWLTIRDKPHAAEAYKGQLSGYNDAMGWLADVAAGKAFLGTSKVVPGAEVRTAESMVADHDGTFNRDRLRGW